MGASRAGSGTPHRAVRRRRWLLVLGGVLVFVLVAALSAVLLRPLLVPGSPPVTAERSRAESARTVAATALARLDGDVRQLLRRGGTTAALRAQLTAVIPVIDVHRRLLAGDGAPTATGSATPAGVSPATVARALQDVGVRSLTDAAGLGSPAVASGAPTSATTSTGATPPSTAPAPEGGMARVLAATGVAQVQWADRLAGAAGITLPDATRRIGGTTHAGGSTGAACPSATPTGTTGTPGTPASDPSSPSATPSPSPAPGPGEALARAQLTEQRAVYTYEVLRARAGATLPVATTAERAHRLRLATAAETARALCRAVEPQRPAFAVDRAVLDTPTRATAAIARLEQDTTLAWGDVVAFGDATLRARAVPLLLDAARGRTAVTGTIATAPGLSDDLVPATATSGPASPGSAAWSG